MEEPNAITYYDAVEELSGGRIGGPSIGPVSSYVFYDGQTPPTEEAIQVKLAEMQAEYDLQEYARKRQAEYPSIEELVVALYDTDDKADIEAKRAEVKAKYPKPE